MLGGFRIIMLKLWTLLVSSKAFMPKAFTGIFIIVTFFLEGIKVGWADAGLNLGIKIFSAEYVINQNVTLALNNPEIFNFGNFLDILNSVFIIYFFVKFLVKIIDRSFSLNENIMSYIYSVLIYASIEFVVVLIYSGFGIGYVPVTSLNLSAPVLKVAFIPFIDGILYLAMNIQAVLGAVDWFYLKSLGIKKVESVIMNVTNSTFNQTLG